jgi:uncharacterized protein YndB with AHSA1/START domain
MPSKKPLKTLRQVVHIPASPTAVYKALIDPKKHTAFTGAKATGKPKVGAKMTAHDGYITGKYIHLHPDRGIVLSWKTTEWPEGFEPSRLEIALEPSTLGTRLSMIHSEVPAAQAASYREGWTLYYWKPLKQYFS